MLTLREIEVRTVVVGTGAAGYNAAIRLHQLGEHDLAVLTENTMAGTSRNTGSDKQTYYKLSLAGHDLDSVRCMAEDLFKGQCVDGDLALCEAALSARCFYHLIEVGVPFPDNEYGESIGYKTDHDRARRASSVGPYTSKVMTECLERDVKARKIPVLDKTQVIKLLVKDGQAHGVLCIQQTSTCSYEFLLIWCNNIVLATGGPAGIYHRSVYPVSQYGSSGMAFAAGIKGQNLTEWQFGMASLRPRWNVSGTYMQALPRFVSTDQQGQDQQEFLLDYFDNPSQIQFLTFLKGYQWPFDCNKIYGGSSMIDLLVYQETVLKGRRVFLDFLHNPCGKTVEFSRLPKEAYEYLHAAGACFGTPIDRLRHMNEPAVQFYLEHGVDLNRQMLEIAVCAQHNNGGLAVDQNWQTNVEGVYAIGEVCGSHGVTRPGGSALNAGQVGGLRAAEHIVFVRNREKLNRNDPQARHYCFREAQEYMARMPNTSKESNLKEIWSRATMRMSRAGGMVRNGDLIQQALLEVRDELLKFPENARISGDGQIGEFYRLYDLLITQRVYLTAMKDYILHGGGSRGSALYMDKNGIKPGDSFPDLFRCNLDNGRLGDQVQEIELKQDHCCVTWRMVRPLPDPECFFETQWKAFRERRRYCL